MRNESEKKDLNGNVNNILMYYVRNGFFYT